ncbi:SDR family oxidoreductase [Cryptosporangium phraense]|uniref:SDR family oxidoreductase n=1 Tax=Cryptosporangium phraense TaxID=2593070 RepID=A0A545AIM7_9ACTN|nr:SDR family oxidoreductase [Cryptosporangium phraense]TQS41163.1 SDR family oxidoreductase [Cryptosporangium phraense]
MATVLITGASQGIGRAAAVELARRGHRVVATARNADDLAGLDVAQRLRLDVTDPASVEQAVASAGPVDVLVSNAGQTMRGPVERTPVAEIGRLFDLNALGAIRVTQAVLPGMRERGTGRLVYVSSVLGRLTVPLIGAYAASKWGLEALVETLAAEVRRFGVDAVLLEPGAVSSDGPAAAPVYLTDDDVYQPLAREVAGARSAPIPPAEVAEAIADVVDLPAPVPLRVPVGDAARAALSAAGRR